MHPLWGGGTLENRLASTKTEEQLKMRASHRRDVGSELITSWQISPWSFHQNSLTSGSHQNTDGARKNRRKADRAISPRVLNITQRPLADLPRWGLNTEEPAHRGLKNRFDSRASHCNISDNLLVFVGTCRMGGSISHLEAVCSG